MLNVVNIKCFDYGYMAGKISLWRFEGFGEARLQASFKVITLPVVSCFIFFKWLILNMFIIFFCPGKMMLYLLVTCRWRIHIRKALSPSKKTEPASTAVVENENEVDEDDRLLNEMEELTNALDRKKKREKKILAKRRAKVCGFLFAFEWTWIPYI